MKKGLKHIKQLLSWLAIVIYIIVSFSFVSKREDRILCNTLDIAIEDSLFNRFLSQEDIHAILNLQKISILGEPINHINTKIIEQNILKNAAVKNAQAYKTIDGHLNIEIEQRTPIVRVIDDKQRGYYMDKNGFIMPLSVKHSSHVLILSGHIPEVVPLNFSGNIDKLDLDKKGVKEFYNIFRLMKYITEDQFWNAQFLQAYIAENGEVELIPRVGAHMIYLGQPDEIEKKFRKLQALYKTGFKELGWNNYEKINLKYSDQIICTKR